MPCTCGVSRGVVGRAHNGGVAGREWWPWGRGRRRVQVGDLHATPHAQTVPATTPPDESWLAPEDVADLDERLARVADEEEESTGFLLVARLLPLVSRGVPVRQVLPGPVPGSVRIRFADDTVVVARVRGSGQAARMALGLGKRPLLLESVSQDHGAVHLDLHWSGGGHVVADVIGRDQPA